MPVAKNDLAIREITEPDFASMVDYFLKADIEYLAGMGVDAEKLPRREEWLQLLTDEFRKPPEKKGFFYVIWLLNNVPVGHSNINKIIFGEEAYMHLHLWSADIRQKGMGFEFIKMSLPYYFEKFKLKRLYCEPYAFNPAPNKTLKKLGFDFLKEYDTIPGWINLHQTVNKWCLDVDKYLASGFATNPSTGSGHN
jgi:RimJ/RimL family protein N-acetyltransferase